MNSEEMEAVLWMRMRLFAKNTLGHTNPLLSVAQGTKKERPLPKEEDMKLCRKWEEWLLLRLRRPNISKPTGGPLLLNIINLQNTIFADVM